MPLRHYIGTLAGSSEPHPPAEPELTQGAREPQVGFEGLGPPARCSFTVSFLVGRVALQ